MRKKGNKFNAKKVTVDGIKFDSEMEAKYYAHLMKLKGEGQIKDFETQPPFILQDSFRLRGELVRQIKYVADFRVFENDGSSHIVDVKGMETADFKIKAKLYKKKFPEPLKLVTFSKIDGGWIELEDLKKARKKRKEQKQNDK
jgi:Protein of unknown function (DUF1064)